jgi:excisionase family DNA binding protein
VAPERKYLSPTEVAEMYGLTRQTVLEKVATGELPAKRINKRVVRIAIADAEAWGTPVRGARAHAS